MIPDITFLHIKRALESGRECFFCALENEIERKYIDTYLYELIMDASSRQKIMESRGFCNHHFYKMLVAASKPETSDGHGMALVMKSVSEKLVEDLNKQKRHSRSDFNEMLANEARCPACIHLSDFMEMYAEKVIELLSSHNEEFWKFLKESKGLCVPHFVLLVHEIIEIMSDKSRGIVEFLTEIETKNLNRIDSELADYIKKQSYEFSEKDRAKVDGALLRSIEKIRNENEGYPKIVQE